MESKLNLYIKKMSNSTVPPKKRGGTVPTDR